MPDTKTASSNGVMKMLTDKNKPLSLRTMLLRQTAADENPQSEAVLASLVKAASRPGGKDKYDALCTEITGKLKEMEDGPLRMAYFLRLTEPAGFSRRGEILMTDGAIASCILADDQLADELRRGDQVWVEAQGKAILFRQNGSTKTGEEARLERWIDDERIEASLREQGNFIYHASEELLDQRHAGEAEVGATIIVCPQAGMGFCAVPPVEGVSHYRFLVQEPVPDVEVARDIGDAPAFIGELIEHVHTEMTRPELGKRYRMRRLRMVMLAGVSGSGKTHSVLGFWNEMYSVMSDVTGVAPGELPQRVVRVRASQLLSKWFGEADKNIDRLFDEIVQLSREIFIGPDGVEHVLPLLVIFEEADGLARARGSDSIHDRVMTTLLQRLEPSSREMRDQLIVFLFTTNVPHLVDPAFMRRAGGNIERFGRLGRKGFAAVLEKHLDGRPFASQPRENQKKARQRVASDLITWLFSPNGEDKGQVELTYIGSTSPAPKFRRDFLTGGLVDRAVQQAAAEACRAERLGDSHPGLSTELLMKAFSEQVKSIVEQLDPNNVGNYLTLPDGVRVSNVRRIEQSTVLPVELAIS